MKTMRRVAVSVLACVVLAGRTTQAQQAVTLESLLRSGVSGDATAPLAPPAVERLPVPGADDVAAAKELIRQAFEEEYAAADKTPRRLIDKLLATADSVEDGTRRYALLIEAERVAIERGDIDSAVEAAAVRSRLFAVDPAECRLQVIVAAGKADEQDDGALFRMCIDLADESLASGQIEVAEKAVVEAFAAAKRVERRERQAAAEERKRSGRRQASAGTAAALVEQAVAKQRDVKERRKAHREYEAALETLRQQPGDAPANGVVGRYRCFVMGDWAEGLKALQSGDSEALQAVARDELGLSATEPPQPARFLAVAGAWWKVAEGTGLAADESEAIKRHAAGLYRRALPGIQDPLEKALATKRIAAATGDAEKDAPLGRSSAPDLRDPALRRGGILRIPSSVFLPAPAALSPGLVPLLITPAEAEALQNHVNTPDDTLGRAKEAFMERVYQGFGVERWTTIDAVYLVELNDRLNVLLGKSSIRGPTWSLSGSRESCKAALASCWLFKSKSEQEFVQRAQSLPTDALKQLPWRLEESEVKKWLLQLGPEYASTRRKLQAVDYLIQQGITSSGIRRYRDDLARTIGSDQP